MPFDSAPQPEFNPRLRPALVADLFCGAGGSSTGAQRALAAVGRRMELVAVNHWDRAIETHSLNHPTARHYCMDLESAKPAELVPELRLDLLMASPTCTYHSRARGGRPTSDQQRMDPWQIVRWCTDLRVSRLLIENVPEYVAWGPIDTRTGRPIKGREGEYFRAWIKALQGIGMVLEWRIVCCADYGDATTRQRFMMIGRSDGKKLEWPNATHARASQAQLLGLKPWRAAREIIDWTHKGRSIFNRKKPLSDKTIARIMAGAVKFKWPEPFLVILRNHMTGQSVDGPLPTITSGGTHIGLAEPMILNRHGDNGSVRCQGIEDPMPTATCRGAGYLVEPFIAVVAHGNDANEKAPNDRRARSIDEPLQTVSGLGSSFAIVEPFVFPMNQSKERLRGHRSVDDPLCTITATGTDLGVVEPIGPTFILSQPSGGAPRSTDEPVPTITTGGHGGSGTALIAPYYGSGSGLTCGAVNDPLPTVTSKARFGMVVPVTNSNGGPGPRDVGDPLPTLTTAKGGEFAIVMPVTHADGLNRAQNTDDPLPTITGAHRGELAFVTCENGRYDILFRMLEPSELAAAMGFSDDESPYEFVGNKTEQTKQIGNAVPVNTAAALVAALMRT